MYGLRYVYFIILKRYSDIMISSWITCKGLVSDRYQFPVRSFGVSYSPPQEVISDLANELVSAHSNPQMVKDELNILSKAAGQLDLDIIKAYVEDEILPSKDSVITRIGNFGEIIAAKLLIERDGYWFPIYKLRFREKQNWAMRLTDLFLIKSENSCAPVICFGEVKTRSSTYDRELGIKGHDSLAKDDALDDSPEILKFVCRMLYEANKYEEARFISDLRCGVKSYVRKHTLFILHEASTWDDEIIDRLDGHTIDPRLVDFTVNVLQISELRHLIDTCYLQAWESVRDMLDE
jgi:hypothetical protein